MNQTIKIKRGNKASLPSNLNDGEFFLIKDEGKLIIKNNDKIIEFVNSSELQLLVSQLNSLVDTTNTISENVANLNNEIDLKLTSPSGNKGQILGYIDTNLIGAVDAPLENVNIIVSSNQPQAQKKDDLWFKII